MMSITLSEFIYLLPFLILGFAIIGLLFLSLILRVSTKVAAIFTISCLLFALLSSSIIGYRIISQPDQASIAGGVIEDSDSDAIDGDSFSINDTNISEQDTGSSESAVPEVSESDSTTQMATNEQDIVNHVSTAEDTKKPIAKVWQPTYITALFTCDGYGLLYTSLILLMSIVVSTLSFNRLTTQKNNESLFYLIVLFMTLGATTLLYSSHLISLYIGIELLSLPLVGLIGYEYAQKYSLEAAVKYMILSTVATSFLLLGVAFYYAATGELTFSGLSFQLSTLSQPSMLLLMGVCLMLVGICFKLSLVPFQLWLPDVYQGAPAYISLLLTAGKIAVFCAVARLFLLAPIVNNETIRIIMVAIAFCSIVLGNIFALTQQNIKRLLAYSSITHFGYLLIALIAVQYQVLALETIGVYLIGYILANICVIGVISLESESANKRQITDNFDLTGLFWRRPVIALSMVVGLLSLASIPLTIGFISRFSLLLLGVTAELWWLVGAIIIGSALGLYFYLKLIVNLYIRPTKTETNQKLMFLRPIHLYKIGVNELFIVASALIILLCGIYPKWLFNLVSMAQFLAPN